jgi:hypothetical protein
MFIEIPGCIFISRLKFSEYKEIFDLFGFLEVSAFEIELKVRVLVVCRSRNINNFKHVKIRPVQDTVVSCFQRDISRSIRSDRSSQGHFSKSERSKKQSHAIVTTFFLSLFISMETHNNNICQFFQVQVI